MLEVVSLSKGGLCKVEGWGEQEAFVLRIGLTTPASFQAIT